MHDHRKALTLVALLALCLGSGLPLTADDGTGRDLIAASQRQDLATVKRLLAAGVDVDSKSRYGATALFFAVDKGNLEMVEVLLAEGASVDVTDTFYESTPLGWGLSNMEGSSAHRQIVLRLLEKGPADAKEALLSAVRQGDVELAKAVLKTQKIEPIDMQAAQRKAEEEQPEIAALLTAALLEMPVTEQPVQALSDAERQRYTGQFRNAERELMAKLFVEEEDLKIQVGEAPSWTLDCIGDDTFLVRQEPGIQIGFRGRGGLVEGFVLKRGNTELTFASHTPDTAADATPEVTQAAEAPAALETPTRQAARPWPAFRGANASGNGDGQGIPFTWQGESGEHIRWRTRIPGIGLSSPVVWGDRVFVTTAISGAADDTFRTGLYGDVDSVDDTSEHVWKVYALDRRSGEILWQRQASRRSPQVKRHLKSSHANPTPVTDGRFVVAHFASEGIFCYDMEGNLKWKKDLGTLNSGWFYDASYEWGFASSPILHDGQVILQTDIHEGSFIAALDLETGEQLWRTERDEIPTWGTPTVLPAASSEGVDEIVTNGTTVRGYDAVTGKELWTLSPNSEVTVGTPVIGEGMAFVTGGYPPARPIYAIKPGGRGDLSLADDATSNEHIAWSVNPGGTYIPTPIYYRGILYMLNNGGRLAAYDATSGERLYRQRVDSGTSFSASPVAADGRLLITSEEGITYVVRAGKTYEELGRNELGEVVMTTPAISDGVLILRGIEHVYGIAADEDEASGGEGM